MLFPRHALLLPPTNMVASAVAGVALSAVSSKALGARRSYGAAVVRPASGAPCVVPRRSGAGASLPRSNVHGVVIACQPFDARGVVCHPK